MNFTNHFKSRVQCVMIKFILLLFLCKIDAVNSNNGVCVNIYFIC